MAAINRTPFLLSLSVWVKPWRQSWGIQECQEKYEIEVRSRVFEYEQIMDKMSYQECGTNAGEMRVHFFFAGISAIREK